MSLKTIKREAKFFLFFVIGYIPVFFGIMYVIQEEPQSGYFFQGMIVAFIVTYITRSILLIMKNME
ncbi:hypothetical protein [Flammeovirga kamogawensis]|uniref:Uncharacterized protein n=1 Tax=Flammeovirga kamogawensis TaxID=373891 RepID=A0ABX8GZB5_9BACT|nr:hypothetical protein [Flammeovirga kamogawensis]MBB6459400.1 multisubunit Na+/H+ antiporter MnhE subunit [Flammeovirga kamogawensis]QWG08956.1 hypothetical protein KM029_08425 [Flammeovirga kamogawensis]TRX67246.1 hypothetical protein EO216_03470 [Flammeovirga kamogawensis]